MIKLILTLETLAVDHAGWWRCGEAGPYTRFNDQAVRDPTPLGVQLQVSL
jgi:hypothetical protein